ncbi:MAG: ATP-binding protein [Muribaculaceae bacterium]|nr:ATP-binding protein [Muribaculaceae bacterium]
MKDLKAKHAEALLRKLVGEGEHVNQDFKFTVNDPRKIARTISAFANNSGGHLLIGVDDNGQLRGVRNEEDIYVVEAAATVYCEPACLPEFTAYKAKGGAVIIRAEIAKASSRPVYVKEEKNRRKAYYRVADENIIAHPLIVRAWKAIDDPDNSILYNMSSARVSILTALEKGPVTFEKLAIEVGLSKKNLEEVIVQLTAMGVVDFIYVERQFMIYLKQ